MGKTLAKEFSDDLLKQTGPFQFALQTRAGSDALAQTIRLISDGDGLKVILSLDGIGAFDHDKRNAILP